MIIPSILAQADPFFDSIPEFSIEDMKATQQFWDNLWAATYGANVTGPGPTLSILYFASVAKLFLALLFPVWLYLMAQAFGASRDIQQSSFHGARFMVSGFLCFLLLSGSTQNLASIQLGFRQVFLGIQKQTLQLGVADRTLASVTTDQLLTHGAKEEIYKDAQECKAMPAPPVAIPGLSSGELPDDLTAEQQQLILHFRCWESLTNKIERMQNEDLPVFCLGNGKSCRSFLDFLGRVGNSLGKAIGTEIDKIANGEVINIFSPFTAAADLFAGAAAWASFKPLLGFVQWIYTSSLETAFWLSGLISPFMATMLLIPQFAGAFWQWVIFFFSFGINIVLYGALVGIFSFLLETQTNNLNISSLAFPMLLTLGAPIISSGLVFIGATRVTNVLTKQGIDVGFAALSLGFSGAGGLSRGLQARGASNAMQSASQTASSPSGGSNINEA